MLNSERDKKIAITTPYTALAAESIDVNEQSPTAVNFYKHMGLKSLSRSTLDDMGKAFPTLHMTL